MVLGIQFLFYQLVFKLFSVSIRLLLLGWLHSTDVDEAPNQNGGDNVKDPTWIAPEPPPEVGGAVAGRP